MNLLQPGKVYFTVSGHVVEIFKVDAERKRAAGAVYDGKTGDWYVNIWDHEGLDESAPQLSIANKHLRVIQGGKK